MPQTNPPIEGVAGAIKACAKIADEMRVKHGSPTGDAYSCGTWDQGVRIAQKIRALTNQIACPSGGEATYANVVLRNIAEGNIAGASTWAMQGDWKQLFEAAQAMARSALSPDPAVGATAEREAKLVEALRRARYIAEEVETRGIGGLGGVHPDAVERELRELAGDLRRARTAISERAKRILTGVSDKHAVDGVETALRLRDEARRQGIEDAIKVIESYTALIAVSPTTEGALFRDEVVDALHALKSLPGGGADNA